MKMKFLDPASSQPVSHLNVKECKSVSHFNWFARYKTPQDEKNGLKSQLKNK